MPFYSFEMVLVGIILLSAMVGGGISLWLKRRRNSLEPSTINENLENLSLDSTKDN